MPVSGVLPDWLYCPSVRSVAALSPAASFDIVGTTQDQPWISHTAPTTELRRKVIVVTAETCDVISEVHLCSLIHFLTGPDYQFPIQLWILPSGQADGNAAKPESAVNADEDVASDRFPYLWRFNPETDYPSLLTALGKTHDEVVVLDFIRSCNLLAHLQKTKTYIGPHFYNAFQLTVNVDVDDASSSEYEWSLSDTPIDHREIISELNKALVDCNSAQRIEKFSELNYDLRCQCHEIFLQQDEYWELTTFIVDNSNQLYKRQYRNGYYLAALMAPALRAYFTPDILYNFSEMSVVVAAYVLSDDEFRSRLSSSDIEKTIEFQPELRHFFKRSPTKNHSKYSLSDVQFLKIHNISQSAYDFIEQVVETQRLNPSNIKAIVFAFDMPALDSEKLVSVDNDFNVFFSYLLRECSGLRYLAVPKEMYRAATGSVREKNIVVFMTDYRCEEYYSPIMNEYHQPPAQAVKGKLYLGNRNTSSSSYFGNEGTEHVKYTMIEGGEVLTPGFEYLSLRTGLLRYEYDPDLFVSRINWRTVIPIDFSPRIPISFSNESCTLKLRTIDNLYCYAQLTQSVSSGRTRLLSLHPHEALVSFCIDDDLHTAQQDVNGVCYLVSRADNTIVNRFFIQHGDDNFYYFYSEQPTSIAFIVAVEKKYLLEDHYTQLSADDPIRAVIESYFTNPKFNFIADPDKPAPLIGQYDDFAKWGQALYEDCMGVCWHRAGVALPQQIKKIAPLHTFRMRSIEINRNHVILEILNCGRWIQVDLGGGANVTLHYPVVDDSRHASDAISSERASVGSFVEPALDVDRCLQEEERNRLAKLESILAKSIHPMPCDSIDRLLSMINNPNHKKILLSSPFIPQIALLLVTTLRDEKQLFFYADSLASLAVNQEHIVIEENDQPVLMKKTALMVFLENAAITSEKKAVLCIDVREQTLTTNTLTIINTLFDKKQRTYCGMTIPDNVCVIALTDAVPNDVAFLSRQDLVLEASHPMTSMTLNDNTESDIAQSVFVDLQGASDWLKQLFGPILMFQNRAIWRKSDFSKRIADLTGSVTIAHYSVDAEKQIKDFFKKSKALGYFEYHEHRISFPERCDFSFSDTYDFSDFRVSCIQLDCTARHISRDDIVINTHLFDVLLRDKIIEAGLYSDIPGLLEKNAKKPLTLFISSALSDAQWWSLLSNAQYYGVNLTLKLAPMVYLPQGVLHDTQYPVCESVEIIPNRIFVTNDVKKIIGSLMDNQENALVLDVAEYSFQNLFFRITYKNNHYEFSDFAYLQSDFLKHLMQGGNAILTGQWSEELLSFIDTLLLPNPYLWINGEKYSVPGKLTIVIQDKRLASNSESRDHGQLLWAQHEVISYSDNQMPTMQCVYHEEDGGDVPSADFIGQRKTLLFDALRENALLQLIGFSNTGKSSFFRTLQTENESECVVYHEMNNIVGWAQNGDKSRYKILLIDAEKRPYTMFEPLKPNGSRVMLIDHQLYRLDDMHKVVFLGDEESLGVENGTQQLFEDRVVPVIHLANCSFDYIYEQWLKPIYISAQLDISEACFKEDARLFIVDYMNSNTMRLRELQHFVVSYCILQKNRMTNHRLFSFFRYNAKADFILTQSSREVREKLESFLLVQRLRCQKKLIYDAGLNAVFIAGEPGVGKTVTVKHYLEKIGLSFVKIDASLSETEIIQKVIAAFRAGIGFWIDEFDACLTERVMKTVKQVLSGQDPETGLPAIHSGCFGLFTGNGGMHAGRAQFTDALQSRLLCLALSKPTADDIATIGESIDVRQTVNMNALITDFLTLQRKSSRVTLRAFCEHFKEIAIMYQKEVHTGLVFSSTVH